MKLSTSQILDILARRGITPDSDEPVEGVPAPEDDLPEIGELDENETVYRTSLKKVLGNSNGELDYPISENPRISEWWSDIERVIGSEDERKAEKEKWNTSQNNRPAPEPNCAWYCPVHYFGDSWGIYIRESCILSTAKDIACEIDWRHVKLSPGRIQVELLRCAFHVFFLHEQFHHKVESLGFRLVISTNSDRYRPYKAKVYRPAYLSSQCLEESLANADSYRRLDEQRFNKRISSEIKIGLRKFLKSSFSMQPAGYREASKFLDHPNNQKGLYELQSQMLDGALVTSTPPADWSLATNMIKSLMNIEDDIYIVLPIGARPIFNPTTLDPGVTTSSRNLVAALIKHYSYRVVTGGKGSHIRLKKKGSPSITVPANRRTLSPEVMKNAIQAIGNYPLTRLPDLLDGSL